MISESVLACGEPLFSLLNTTVSVIISIYHRCHYRNCTGTTKLLTTSKGLKLYCSANKAALSIATANQLSHQNELKTGFHPSSTMFILLLIRANKVQTVWSNECPSKKRKGEALLVGIWWATSKDQLVAQTKTEIEFVNGWKQSQTPFANEDQISGRLYK